MKKYTIPVSENLSLPCIEWKSQQENNKGKIVFLHGFTNHAGNYSYMGEWYSQQGFDFLAYDHRDHGASPLRNQPCTVDDMVNDARAVVQYAYQDSGNNKVLLMGSSMGGALSILASQGEMQDKLSGLVLWAPQVVSTSRRKALFMLLSAINKVMPNFKIPTKTISVNNLPKQCDDKALTDRIAEDPLMLRNPRLDLCHRVLAMGDLAAKAEFKKDFKVLMLFGGDDMLIYKHDIKMFVKRVEESDASIEYKFYPENHHMLWGELNREAIYQDSLKWYES